MIQGSMVIYAPSQGESNMHRIVVTNLCRLRPLFPKGNWPFLKARKRHINFEHINFLKVGTTLWDNPPLNQREKFIFPVFRGEHINFLARLTLGQPAVCPRATWTLTSLCLCAFFLPNFWHWKTPQVYGSPTISTGYPV